MAVAAPRLTVDIVKRFASGATVAARLDVPLEGGSMLVLFGPSGAGKTTTLRAVAGLERPEAGAIRFHTRVWFDGVAGVWVPPQQRRIGYVVQDAALFPHLTVRANVGFGLPRGDGAARRRRVDDLLALVGAGDLGLRLPRQLSGGETARVALARALAPRPALLLLDEPFAPLDAPTRGRLRTELRSLLRRTATPAVLVTHDRSDALALGDVMAVVVGGRVRQVGPVQEVFSRPATLAVADSVGVEAVLPGRVRRVADGIAELDVAGIGLRAVDAGIAPGTDAFACIRAENVTLERQAAAGASPRNHLRACVVGVQPEGAVERVALDCGFPLVALVTRQAREELALEPGTEIVAVVKATSVHLVPR